MSAWWERALQHELRQPLFALRARLQLAKDGLSAEDVAATLADVDALMAIVDGLAGPGAVVDVDVHAAILAAREVLAHQLPPGLRLGIDALPGTTARCDPGALRQILVNLLGNALDAAGPDGWIHVSAGGDAERVVIEVHNDGAPLPALFDVFAPHFSTKGEGRGLGLFVSRQIAESQGGTLIARVRPGDPDGATFVLHLPSSRAPR